MIRPAMTVVDPFRMFSGVLGAILIGLVLFTIYHYIRMLKKGHKGLIPSHVIMVGCSYFGTLLYVSLDMWNRIGWPITWRLPLAFASLSIGLPALMCILRFVTKRDRELH